MNRGKLEEEEEEDIVKKQKKEIQNNLIELYIYIQLKKGEF